MTKKEAITKEVAIIDMDNYPMLLDPTEVSDVVLAIQENMEDENISPENIFSSSQGLLTVMPNMKGEDRWDGVETEDGIESFKEITGIILYIGSKRARFEGKFGEGSKIPLCTSADGITGIANETIDNGGPGGSCIDCEYSQFGANNEPPECSHKKPMFVLAPEISPALPVMFNVPETNFSVLKKYKAGLSRYGSKVYDVETRFSLKGEKTQTGRSTSLLIMEKVSNIKKSNPEAHKAILKVRETLLPYMQPASIILPEGIA